MRVLAMILALCLSGAVNIAPGFSQAVEKELSGQAVAPSSLLIDDIQFYYKIDSDTRFLNKRAEWEAGNKGREQISLEALEALAAKAYAEAGVEHSFNIWRDQGGPNPLVFRPKVHLRNNTDQAWLNVQIQVVMRAKIGELLADPELFLTDYDHLSASAEWENLFVETVSVDVLAPGEDKLVDISPFQLFYFLSLYKNRWPEYVEVQATLLDADGGATFGDLPEHQGVQALQMIPDHFVMPYRSRRRLTQ